jgi:cytochrome P450
MSYGPFLGGKRICLGKTFAENIAKATIAIIISTLDFEFVDQNLKFDKPATTFNHK